MSTTPPPDSPQPVSGQPWSTPSGDPMSVEPYRPPTPPPTAPVYQPGQASPPPPQQPGYPPTSEFPAQPGYDPTGDRGSGHGGTGYERPGSDQSGYPGSGYQAGYAPEGYPQPGSPPPGYGPGPVGYPQSGYGGGYPPPGHPAPGYDQRPPPKSNIPLVAVIIAVALLLCGGTATAAVLVTRAVTDQAKEAVKPITPPAIPTQAPDLPEVPDLPDLPTDLPDLPGGTGTKVTVTYEVTGDGPAEILYTAKLGEGPRRVSNATLPWRLKTTVEGPAFVSVTAARIDGGTGSISCRTSLDGKRAAQATREGAFATVSCTKLIYN